MNGGERGGKLEKLIEQSKLCWNITFTKHLAEQDLWVFCLIVAVSGFSHYSHPRWAEAQCSCISGGGGGEVALTCPYSLTSGHSVLRGHGNPLTDRMQLEHFKNTLDAAMAPHQHFFLESSRGFSLLFLELYRQQFMLLSNRASFLDALLSFQSLHARSSLNSLNSHQLPQLSSFPLSLPGFLPLQG